MIRRTPTVPTLSIIRKPNRIGIHSARRHSQVPWQEAGNGDRVGGVGHVCCADDLLVGVVDEDGELVVRLVAGGGFGFLVLDCLVYFVSFLMPITDGYSSSMEERG